MIVSIEIYNVLYVQIYIYLFRFSILIPYINLCIVHFGLIGMKVGRLKGREIESAAELNFLFPVFFITVSHVF